MSNMTYKGKDAKPNITLQKWVTACHRKKRRNL